MISFTMEPHSRYFSLRSYKQHGTLLLFSFLLFEVVGRIIYWWDVFQLWYVIKWECWRWKEEVMKYGVFVCEKMSFLPIDVNCLELVKYPVDVGSLLAINNWIYEICLSPCKVEAEVIGSRTNGCICNYQLKKLYICVFAYLAWLF